jgi:hypothetical protein
MQPLGVLRFCGAAYFSLALFIKANTSFLLLILGYPALFENLFSLDKSIWQARRIFLFAYFVI